MSEVYDCTSDAGRVDGVAAAAAAVRRGEIVVLPTDTVYGVGCDAFSVDAVQAVLAAKGRGREMPPPVLVPGPRTVDGLAREVPEYARALIERCWPGPLTLVLKAQSSLQWDLGDTNGTVAVRMPDNAVALELLQAIGPMAVTSANTTGVPAATTAQDAQAQLGESVAVYLDGGPSPEGEASTILDCTGVAPVTLRQGALSQPEIDAVLAAAEQARSEAAAQAQQEALAAAERAQRAARRAEAERDRAADPRRGAGPRVAGSRRRRD